MTELVTARTFIFTQNAQQDFDKLVTTKSALVGNLLGKLMMKKYPDLHPGIKRATITFDDLLHWHLWPNFITLHGNASNYHL